MCGGGVEPPNPKKQAAADIERMREQAALDKKTAGRERHRAAVGRKREEEEWQGDLGTARNVANKNIGAEFTKAGLDPADYMTDINRALDVEQNTKSVGGPTGFASDIGTNVLGDIRGAKVRGFEGDINKWAPEGFEETTFASTADDAIIDAILGEQYGTSKEAIDRALARGNLNQQGYTAAMANLDTQKAAGMSKLQDYGGGVLGGYRSGAGDIAETARTGASGWDFGDTFDPKTYETQLGTYTGEKMAGLEGDIRNVVGGEQFFNIADIITKGGVAQGAQNTGLGGMTLPAAIAKRKTDEERPRGLGTQGSF